MTIVSVGRKPFEEMLSESRVRENLTHGLMRGWWKPLTLLCQGRHCSTLHNQDTSSNYFYEITKIQDTIISVPTSLFGYWSLEFEYCLVLVSWLLVISASFVIVSWLFQALCFEFV